MGKRLSKRTRLYPYKSEFEKQLHEGILKSADYEPKSVEYTINKKYTPDFVIKDGTNELWFEAKGRFRDYGDAQRYISIRDQWADGEHSNVGRNSGSTGISDNGGTSNTASVKFIFIFYDAGKKAYPQCKRRKDGTFLTLGEWADKNGFEWCTVSTFKKEWLK